MPGWELGLIIAVIVLAAVIVWLVLDRRKSMHLKSRFGPEYDRTLSETGNRRRAEHELERREHRVERLNIRPLSAAEHERFLAAWQADQARFVDDPAGAVTEADRLVQHVMKTRGYPVTDFDQRVEDISVDHPHLVQNYRSARELVGKHQRGEASTEDLRRALVYYRGLFDELLEVQEVNR
jgi:hypothetical protein